MTRAVAVGSCDVSGSGNISKAKAQSLALAHGPHDPTMCATNPGLMPQQLPTLSKYLTRLLLLERVVAGSDKRRATAIREASTLEIDTVRGALLKQLGDSVQLHVVQSQGTLAT